MVFEQNMGHDNRYGTRAVKFLNSLPHSKGSLMACMSGKCNGYPGVWDDDAAELMVCVHVLRKF